MWLNVACLIFLVGGALHAAFYKYVVRVFLPRPNGPPRLSHDLTVPNYLLLLNALFFNIAGVVFVVAILVMYRNLISINTGRFAPLLACGLVGKCKYDFNINGHSLAPCQIAH